MDGVLQRSFRAALGIAVGVGLALAAAPALAIGLDQAKAQGLVGEQADGYLGVVTGSPEASALVSDVNAKRRAEYAEIAKKRGTSVDAVAALAGQKLVARTPSGQFVKGSSGGWVKK
jgi:uncharacterized protein YdbL (DUF1318 family)